MDSTTVAWIGGVLGTSLLTLGGYIVWWTLDKVGKLETLLWEARERIKALEAGYEARMLDVVRRLGVIEGKIDMLVSVIPRGGYKQGP